MTRRFARCGYRRGADPDYGCKNPGVVRLSSPAEIFQSPNKVTLIYGGPIDDGTSGHMWVREIPTDGRPHRDDVAPSYRGDSIGRWDGGTLVVDTTNFRPEVHNLNSGERLHVVERFTALDTVLDELKREEREDAGDDV